MQRFLDRGARITGVKTLSAGHSNETYLVEGIDEILRMPPSEEGLLPPYDMARQHAILSAVKQHAPAVPLPRLLELCTDRDVLGDEFFLMERMPGEAFEYQTPDWVKADPIAVPDRLCRQWFDALVGLHRMDPAKMPPGGRSVRDEAQHWLDAARSANASRDLLGVLEDLVRRPPATSGLATPVHGDPKHGTVQHEGRLTAFLDWEMSQIAEPMLDLGYVDVPRPRRASPRMGRELPGWWSAANDRGVGEGNRTQSRRCRALHGARSGEGGRDHLPRHLFDSGKTKDQRFAAFGALLPRTRRS